MTDHIDFEKSAETAGAEASSSADENRPNVKMAERADWTLFRTVEGLQQKAGVSAVRLRRLVLKELGDNALDVGRMNFGLVDANTFYVEDDGPGLDGTPEQIADLFSIRRPLRSSKLLRLPQRGQLGNGLRVAAGAVLASGGSLAVITRDRRIVLRPEFDGSTSVIKAVKAKQPAGTRIEIGFGPALPDDRDPFTWVRAAQTIAGAGDTYQGRSSPYWYDAAQFHELLLAYGAQPVRSLIAQFDGCTGHSKAGKIVHAARLGRSHCQDVSREQAAKLLTIARTYARPVSADRLGHVGRDAFASMHYAIEHGTVALGRSEPHADVPFTVEAWATKTKTKHDKAGDDVDLDVLINRTPTVAEVSTWRDVDGDLNVQGAGINDFSNEVPKKGAFRVRLNLTTPYCPITSDGKEPDLGSFTDVILRAIETATRKAQRAAPRDKKVSQKDVVLDNLDAVIEKVSGPDQLRFNSRQILYKVRVIVMKETGQELTTGNFNAIITDFEEEFGEIPRMYRDPRGSIYHPHRRTTITLSTLNVEDYQRPLWTFNKLAYIEKEGFGEALKAVGWPERNDCAPMSSKGFSTRAARDLIDKLAEHDEPVTVFCVTDADAPGTMIYQTLQEATKARGARKIKIVHLGLHPWEAIALGLAVEELKAPDKRKPVAQYVLDRTDRAPDGTSWEEWLQTHRIELNAFTTPEFIDWLDRKMAEHGVGKLIPPDDVIAAELDTRLDAKVRAAVTERILREAGFEDQVAVALAEIERPDVADLTAGIKRLFERNPEREWRDHVEATADDLSEAEE